MKSYGYLKYDPRHIETRYKDWWLILQCSEGIALYYRYWIQKEATWEVHSRDWLNKAKLNPNLDRHWPVTQKGIKLTRSAWGPHVSVVRGEKPLNIKLWKKYDGKKVWFEYDPKYLNTNGKHWWFRVISPELESIRQELGLTPQPEYFHRDSQTQRVNPFHLTIGHMLN